MEIGRDFFPRYDTRRRRKTYPPFTITEDQRLRHMLIAGKTGMGKSTLMANMIAQDISAGNGLALIDPHGSIADDVLLLVPPRRQKDVVLLDFTDFEFPVAFNVLDSVPVSQRPTVAGSIVDAFKAAAGYTGFSTPQMDMVLYTASAALLDMPDATMLGIKYVLTSRSYRKRILGNIIDPILKDIWETDYQSMSDKEQREYAKSTLNKIIQLITDPTVRNIIGQPKNRFDVLEIMDKRKILIVKIPHGQLGKEKTRLIGSFLVSVMHSAALRRSPSSPLFALYCDEFHNFNGWEEMLSGLRKFRVALVLATQFLGQLTDDVAAAVEGTVETTVSFRIGSIDAETISKSMTRKVSDLTGLEPFQAYASTGSHTRHLTMSPMPERTYPLSPQTIRDASRLAYATPKVAVEKKIETFVTNTHEARPTRGKR